MPLRPLPVDVEFARDGSIRLIIPKTAGVSYEEAAPRLAAFAAELSAEYDLPVVIESAPERHLHDAAHATAHTHTHAH